MALPIVAQPAVIRAALAAGKHVLSEKPVGPRIAEAAALVREYREGRVTSPPPPSSGPGSGTAAATPATWAVAENFRFYEAYRYAAAEARKLGNVTGFVVRLFMHIAEGEYMKCVGREEAACPASRQQDTFRRLSDASPSQIPPPGFTLPGVPTPHHTSSLSGW